MNPVGIPQFTVADIQIAVGDHEFKKAMALHQKGAVKNIKDDFLSFGAIVTGTQDYNVHVCAEAYNKR